MDDAKTTTRPNSGGPAFPSATGFQGKQYGRDTPNRYDADKVDKGMTLRDYFAIRAPLEIPSWFMFWQAGHPRPALPNACHELSDTQLEEWKGLGDWLDDKDVSTEVLVFRDRYQAAEHAQGDWDEAYERDRYIAWRWAYADMMLAVREKGAGHD